MYNIREELERHVPFDVAEASDKAIMLDAIARYPDIFTRDDPLAHFTASAWVVNEARDSVLMA